MLIVLQLFDFFIYFFFGNFQLNSFAINLLGSEVQSFTPFGQFLQDQNFRLAETVVGIFGIETHGGRILGVLIQNLRKLFGFSTSLRSATQGRAGLVLTFDRFDLP